jgi:hypothetical protein
MSLRRIMKPETYFDIRPELSKPSRRPCKLLRSL